MSDKQYLPNYCEMTECPPPYTVADPLRQQQQQQSVIIADVNSSVFHKGARFNEFARPSIPPPPPGCFPNQFQLMQMEKGKLEVVMTDSLRQNHCENQTYKANYS